MLFFKYMLFHPFMSMSNYANILRLQTTMQIFAPPFWFGSPYSPNVDKCVVYTRIPSSVKGTSVHDDELTDSMVIYTLPMEIVG